MIRFGVIGPRYMLTVTYGNTEVDARGRRAVERIGLRLVERAIGIGDENRAAQVVRARRIGWIEILVGVERGEIALAETGRGLVEPAMDRPGARQQDGIAALRRVADGH